MLSAFLGTRIPIRLAPTATGSSFIAEFAVHRARLIDYLYPGAAYPAGNPIDEIVGDLQLDRMDFIKLDIEGAEEDALRGASGTILKFKPQLSISTEHSKDQFLDVQASVQEIDAAYKGVCSPCEMKRRFQVRPRVRYFFRD